MTQAIGFNGRVLDQTFRMSDKYTHDLLLVRNQKFDQQ